MPCEDLPFSNMDLLYRHMFSAIPVENFTMVLKILGLLTLKLGGGHSMLLPWTPFEETDTIVVFLSLRLGDIERYLGALPSAIRFDSENRCVWIAHASLTDFCGDHRRSREYHLGNRGSILAQAVLITVNHLQMGRDAGVYSVPMYQDAQSLTRHR